MNMKLFAGALAALMVCGAAGLDIDKAKTLGNPSAPVRLELFSDFQCPACKVFHEQVLPTLMRDYISPGKVYLVSHEFPLQMHPYSREAAHYAHAAAEVGRYTQVADALFFNQATWGADGKVWDVVAAVLTPAEQKRVQALAKEPATAAAVQADVNLGNSLHVTQTPTLFVVKGDKRYQFPGPSRENYGLLRSLLDGFLK
jgi:protein-disulfide isomerase